MREPLLPVVSSHDQQWGHSHSLIENLKASARWHCIEGRTHLEALSGRLLGCLRLWWRVTTDKDYLQSRISRRPSWKIAMPCLGLVVLLVDCTSVASGDGFWWWPLVDLPLVACTMGYGLSSIGSQSLLVDATGALVSTLMLVTYFAMYSPMGFNESDVLLDSSYLWLPSMLAVTGFIGFHGLTLMVMWASSVWLCLALPASASDMRGLTIFTTTLIAVGAVAMEFTIALLYCEWQRLLRCNEKLLERATDGFGAVDCLSGIVLSASPKLQETLGSSLVGQALGAGTVHGRDAAALANFLGDAEESLLPEIVLVTWSAATFELEVRMVPYQLQDSQIGFCVQSVGERRYNTVAEICEEAPVSAEQQQRQEQQEQQVQQEQQEQQERQERQQQEPEVEDGAPAVRPQVNLPFATGSAPGEEVDAISTAAQGHVQGDNPPPPDGRSMPAACATQGLAPALPAMRRHGTYSLSSWSISGSGSSKGDQVGDGTESVVPARPRLPRAATPPLQKKVETRTYGVQVDLFAKPPAPLAASTVPKEQQARTLRKKQVSRAWKSAAVDGKPNLHQFLATPRGSRWNAVRQAVLSCNVGGQGCCARHIAWMDVQCLVTEEMHRACGRLPLLADWQCPECFALNSYESFEQLREVFEDEDLQVCVVCHDLVEPQLPGTTKARSASKDGGQVLTDIGMLEAGGDSPAATGSSDGPTVRGAVANSL